MRPEDVDTIEDMLRDHGIADILTDEEFAKLADALRERENIMICDALDRRDS